MVRLLPAIFLPVGAEHDITSHHIVAKIVRAGRDVYTAPEAADRYPYLPLQLYLSAGAAWLSDLTGLPFVALVKLPAVLADAAIAGLLCAVSLRAGRLYALHPVPNLVASVHGQFDALPVLCLLLARRWLVGRESSFGGGLRLGLGVLLKSWPALLGPALLLWLPSHQTRLRFTIGAALPPAAAVILYLARFPHAFGPMVSDVLGYTSLNMGPAYAGLHVIPILLNMIGWLATLDVLRVLSLPCWMITLGWAWRRIRG